MDKLLDHSQDPLDILLLEVEQVKKRIESHIKSGSEITTSLREDLGYIQRKHTKIENVHSEISKVRKILEDYFNEIDNYPTTEQNNVVERNAISYILNQWGVDTLIIQRYNMDDSPLFRGFIYWSESVVDFDDGRENYLGSGSVERFEGIYYTYRVNPVAKHLVVEDRVNSETNKLFLKFKPSGSAFLVLKKSEDHYTLGCYKSLKRFHSHNPNWILTF